MGLRIGGEQYRQCGIQPLRMRGLQELLTSEIPGIEDFVAVRLQCAARDCAAKDDAQVSCFVAIGIVDNQILAAECPENVCDLHHYTSLLHTFPYSCNGRPLT